MADAVVQDKLLDVGLGFVKIFGIGLIVVLILAALIIFAVVMHRRKKWNLNLTLKLPRSDSKIIFTERAKGQWNAMDGIIVVKRKGRKAVPSRPIDPKKWLQGTKDVTLIQVGPEDFVVALEESYQVIKDTDGKEYAIMDIQADIGTRKSWKNYTERLGKATFTFSKWAEKYQMWLITGILMFILFIGFAILWSRLPSICGE